MLSEYPANLSGGEQRRVSIARTFTQNPKLVVADEPTSSLDMENSEIIMKYFQKMAKEGKSMEEILAHFFEGTELKEGVEIVQVEGGEGEKQNL